VITGEEKVRLRWSRSSVLTTIQEKFLHQIRFPFDDLQIVFYFYERYQLYTNTTAYLGIEMVRVRV
jgi:hypothetical protein